MTLLQEVLAAILIATRTRPHSGDTNVSVTVDRWLNKQVMQKRAENDGKVSGLAEGVTEERQMGLLDSVIGSVTGSGSGGSSSTSPMVKALMLLVAAKAASSYMGSSSASAAPQPSGTPGEKPGTIKSGTLKGLPSLDSLIERFRHSGHAEKMESWVGSGQNQPIQPHELEKALGPENVDHLEKETGLPRDQLLSELSKMLPQVVDKLTPNGRPPTPQETAHW